MVWQKMCPRIVISSPPLCDAPVPPQSQTMATCPCQSSIMPILSWSKSSAPFQFLISPILCSNIWLLLYCCALVAQVLIQSLNRLQYMIFGDCFQGPGEVRWLFIWWPMAACVASEDRVPTFFSLMPN